MGDKQFDSLAKRLASRRSTIRAAGAGLLAGLAGTRGLPTAAQEATPEPAGDETDFLFVQTATGGTLTPNTRVGTPVVDGTPTPGGGADYLLTLEGHHGGTVYFSDRPDRILGEAPTGQFLDGLGFTPANPPNAALVTGTDDGNSEVVILELTNPDYDAASGTLTYGATILDDYEGDGLTHAAQQQDASSVPESFDRASLFIDDCPDYTICIAYIGLEMTPDTVGPIPGEPYGACWDWSDFSCPPCSYSLDRLQEVCNERYPDECGSVGCGVG